MRATDNPADRPRCACGAKVKQQRRKSGVLYWESRCGRCQTPYRKGDGRRPHRKLAIGRNCAVCGFVPVDTCQMDVHHKDGDNKNNDPDNVIVLCANCHRLIHRNGTRRGSY